MEGVGGINLKFGIANIYTIIYKIINKDLLLYRQRTSTQCSVITYMGKESEKE